MDLTNEQVQAIVKGVVEDDLPTSRAIGQLVRATLEDDPFDDYQEYRR